MNDTQEIQDRLESEHRRLASLLAFLETGNALQPEDGGRELSVAGQHPADLGSETLERTKELTIARDLSVQVEEIERAQQRLERGEYGVCQACGQAIPPQRLEAKPAARFCLDDQAIAERRA
jgi:RNA polymerase-binding transcription factor DksA